jgi:HlyD family secretion protein
MNTTKILILATVVTFAGCSKNDKEYDATGTFEATEITVSAEQSGQLLQFNVDEGRELKKNQQVGLIDTVQLALKALQLGATMQSIANQRPDVQTQIAATRQQLLKAEQEQDRFAKLVKSGAANSKQLDDATSSVRVLKRQLACSDFIAE